MKTRKLSLNKIAILLTVLFCALITILRIFLTPSLYDEQINKYGNSYIIITITIISIAVIAVLNFLGQKEIVSINKVRRNQGLLVVGSSLVFGVGLLASTVYDVCMWAINKKVPPPTQVEVNRFGEVTSFNKTLIYAVFVFGILAGVFCIWFGLNLLNRSVTSDTKVALGLLLPVGWMWFRVVRYIVSYASAVRISESIYDFLMIIFSLLFLFFLARNVSGVGKSRTATLLATGLITAMLTISGSVTRFVLYFSVNEETALAGNLTGAPDFLLGIFALAIVVAFVYSPVQKSTEQLVEADVVESEAENPKVVEEI